MKIVINGWFYVGKQITGIERFGRELVKALDEIVVKDQVTLLVPAYVTEEILLNNIKVERLGKRAPFLWQQTTLVNYIRKNKGCKCLSVTSNFPLLLWKGYAFLHDISPIVNRDFYTAKFRLKTNWQMKLLMKKKNVELLTISNFSVSEIRRVSKRKGEITIVPCGWEHMQTVEADRTIFEKYPEIICGEYMYAMSSVSPNKNFKWILEVAKKNANIQFVIAGKVDTKIFDASEIASADNVIFLGYVTDGEAKALLEEAKAFIFPSFYEGFGMPPMEALSCNTDIIISDIPCLKEIYGNTAHYINPKEATVNLTKLLEEKVEAPEQLLNIYCWKNAAKKVAEVLKIDTH